MGLPISMLGLKQTFKCIENIEKFIAVKNCKVGIHEKKWFNVQQNNTNRGNLQQHVLEYLDNC